MGEAVEEEGTAKVSPALRRAKKTNDRMDSQYCVDAPRIVGLSQSAHWVYIVARELHGELFAPSGYYGHPRSAAH